MESYKFLKKELKLIDVKYDYLTNKVMDKNIIEHTRKFLEFQCNEKYNSKIFLSSFVITAFPHVVLNNINSEIDKNLFVYSSDLINNFLNLDEKFENQLKSFIKYFNFWKKVDIKYISENVAESLYMFDEINKKLNDDDDIQELKKLQDKIKNQMKIISGNKNISDYNDVEDIFWNKYKIDLKFEKPNHELTYYLLKNIFDLLCEITPKKKKEIYFKEYEEIIDLKYIKQLIDNDAFIFSDFKNIFNYILSKIKEFQSKEDDELYLDWENNILENINSNNSYSELLPEIFKKILYRFNKIKNLKLIYLNL